MKNILITGGHGDIAQAIINELKKENDYTILAPGHNELDVTDWDSIKKTLDDFVPDILINNAGYVVPQSIKTADLEIIKNHIDVNLGGVYYCTALALKVNPNLDIINIGSAAAEKIHATWSEYCATKAAVVMATKCWAADGLYAVCISPGRTKTKMRSSLFPVEDESTLMLPEEFAKVVMKGIHHEFPSGTHIVVHKKDIENILSNKG